MKQLEILVKSSIDGSLQPSLLYRSKNANRPLLVGLHTWSGDRFNQIKNLVPIAEEHDFNLLLPEFRGPNLNTNPKSTEACGSELAKQDIKDAIDYLIDNGMVDKDNVFLVGASGGGHMALMMAGFIPEYFKAIASCVPIADLKSWAEYSEHYGPHVLACCSNNEKEMAKRSPITYIDTIAKANLKILHGKEDRVVPYTQSLNFYLEMLKRHPESRTFYEIFDGGHEMSLPTIMAWIISQYKDKNNVEVTG